MRAEDLLRVLGGPVDVVERQQDLEDGVGAWLAGLGVDQFGELVDAPGDHRAPGDEVAAALVEVEGAPRPEAAAGAGDGGRDLLGAATG